MFLIRINFMSRFLFLVNLPSWKDQRSHFDKRTTPTPGGQRILDVSSFCKTSNSRWDLIDEMKFMHLGLILDSILPLLWIAKFFWLAFFKWTWGLTTSLHFDSKKALPLCTWLKETHFNSEWLSLKNSPPAQKAKAMQWVLSYKTPHFWKHKTMAGSFRDVIWKPNTENVLLFHILQKQKMHGPVFIFAPFWDNYLYGGMIVY